MAQATAPAAAAVPAGRVKARWARVGTLGLTLLAAAQVMLFVAAFFLFSEEIAFFAIPTGIAVVAAFLAWRFGTWANVVGILATLFVGAMTFWLVFGLFAPQSFLDFVPGILFVLGVVLSLFGNIGAIVKRGSLEPTASPGERRVERVALGIVVLAVVASGALALTSRTAVDAAAAAGATPVAMTGFAFEPETITASGDTLLVRNSDPFVHDIAIPALGVEATVVNPGSEVLIELGDAGAGTYTVYCTLHSSGDEDGPQDDAMVGLLELG
jgi:plastocyanin